MKRFIPVLLFLAACSASRPIAFQPTTCPPDPKIDPPAAVAEVVAETADAAEAGARVGRRVGIVAGLIAAVFGGGESETIDESIDRYRRTRDAATVVGAVIGAASGLPETPEGTDGGHPLDVQFDELQQIDALEVTRSSADVIDVRFLVAPDQKLLAQIAAILKDRTIDIEAPGDTALEVRDALIRLGVPPDSLNARRVAGQADIVLRVRLRLDV